MVNLGFIRNSDQLPIQVRQVRVLQSSDPLSTPGESTVRIWKDGRGANRWALDWSVSGPAGLDQWVPLLAQKLMTLAWDAWWLDVTCLARSMDHPPVKALETWGELFWDAYSGDALVLLDVEKDRRSIYQVVRSWEKRFASVRFSPRHDYDGLPAGR